MTSPSTARLKIPPEFRPEPTVGAGGVPRYRKRVCQYTVTGGQRMPFGVRPFTGRAFFASAMHDPVIHYISNIFIQGAPRRIPRKGEQKQ